MEVKGNTLTLTPEEVRKTSDALADVLCWLGGYRAAGGDTMPIDEYALDKMRALNLKLKEMPWDSVQ